MRFNNQAELSKYFRIIEPSDLLGKYKIVDQKGKAVEANPLITEIVGLLINTGENQSASGLASLKEIVDKINSLLPKSTDPATMQFHNFLRVYCDHKIDKSDEYWKGDRGNTITFDEIAKSKNVSKTRMGVIMTSSPFVTMNVRDTNKIAMFLNAVPTIEMSRAVPFLDVRFQFARSVTDGNTKLRAPSLVKFLEGAVDPKGADETMTSALVDKQVGVDGKMSDVFKAGMELFTSPQTLVNPSAGRGVNRYTRVLDPFRPFLSVEQLEVTAAPTVGLFSYKTAKLTLVLHDRSRLGEISDLVRPEIYTNTTLSISYGWKHPNPIAGPNAFGDLINRMVVQNEKYGIVNCSFQFDAVGQCRITLQLAMKGAQDLRVVQIADGPEYQNEIKFFDQLTKDISQLREDAGYKTAREVRAYTVLDMAERGEIAYDPQQLKDIRDLVAQMRTNGKNKPAASELAQRLDALFAPKTGQVEKLNNTIEQTINKKFLELQEGEDPFLDKDSKEYKKFVTEIAKGEPKSKRAVSLAKVMLTFVGNSLRALGNVDEIQFFFYSFNSQAGQLGDTNIGAFPIEMKRLRDAFGEHVKQKGNANMSVYEFAMFLQGAIIQDPRAIGYGLRQEYTVDKNGKAEAKPNSRIDNVLANSVKGKGSFRYPAVEAYIETLAGRPMRMGELASEKVGHDIMRIHVFDKAASPYEPMLQMVRSQTDLQDVVKRDEAKQGIDKKLFEDALQLAKSSGLNIQYNKETQKYSLGEARIEDLKNFITQVIPSIVYGSNNTAVINATLQTQQNQLLSTVQMMRSAGRQNNTEPNGSSHGGIPLRIIPAQLDINTFGCPLFNINQQFFFDAQTGTTIDNIYLLTHLVHTIAQGKFESHIKMVPLDAYGVFESVIAKVSQLKKYLDDV